MCGICGMYDYAGSPVSSQVLQGMLTAIHHRGPDDQGVYCDANLALGMRRLSIIDLAGGAQPIFNEDRSVVVVFNGEIYNYRELTGYLRQRGHTLVTNSDTEVIVHLYEDFADDCVQHLRGMFAFALWDIRRQRLLLVRDRLGIKPLYYTQRDGCLVFGSEVKALLQHPQVDAQLDLDALNNFLSLKYVPAPQTMFAGIHALPPGYLLRCDSAGVVERRYWDVSFAANGNGQQKEEEVVYAEQLEALLRESVQSHLMSDVPFGAFLSGGLDSSIIVALMSHLLNRPVKTFSVGFSDGGDVTSELPYARMVAEQFQTDHHEVLIRPQDLMDLSAKVVWHLDQPIADEATLANYMVAELASRHVKMVLTGEGGDELFAGYARYAGERFSPWFQAMPRSARTMALAVSDHLPGFRRPKLALHALCQAEESSRLVSWFPLCPAETKTALLTPELRRSLPCNSAEQVFAKQLTCVETDDPLSRMLYVDTKLWLPDDLLARGDKTSMAVSVEARVPLLDHKLVEFAATLPSHLKLKRLTRKYLLKKVSRTWLPPAIIDRKKQGFPVPFAQWFRTSVRPFVCDLLSPDTIKRRGLFQPRTVERVLAEHESGMVDHGTLIWALVNVELWHQLFLDT
ncbi:MAG: asparagine synthase (glutamine-hydrolyzing) [Candidatus Binatia bacterium]